MGFPLSIKQGLSDFYSSGSMLPDMSVTCRQHSHRFVCVFLIIGMRFGVQAGVDPFSVTLFARGARILGVIALMGPRNPFLTRG